MNKVLGVGLRIVLFALFAVFIGYFSASPGYEYASADRATVKLSLSHATNRIQPCVTLTPREISELAPNMRQAQRCERARLPLAVELEVDGNTVIRLLASPSGLWSDGPASIYETFELAPRQHRITARLRDTARADGWDYSHTEDVNLEEGRYFTVTFRANNGGFNFR
jgi:hypothetical protein